jgi:hypothetical protein
MAGYLDWCMLSTVKPGYNDRSFAQGDIVVTNIIT